ncbi:hypothetical protein PORCRE_391 [Porphyromonas crevioricanis JCM 15906]|uniref:Uncharacterized protein n=1 Tax=Porphyromonas crevioricanis JCM 15906 TaxID=1305617 RepID=S4PGH0_9PORP|nr:hypothetical protein PORCRE_391 [Porphyromonas crevioricanis JCM 15906]
MFLSQRGGGVRVSVLFLLRIFGGNGKLAKFAADNRSG